MKEQTCYSLGSSSVVDASEKRRKQFEEIPPFSVDPDTGKILNKSSKVLLREVEPINVQERIDSYYESSDLKHILSRIARGSGEVLPDKSDGKFRDRTTLPKDPLEWRNFLISHKKEIEDEQARIAQEKKAQEEKNLEMLRQMLKAQEAKAAVDNISIESNKGEEK